MFCIVSLPRTASTFAWSLVNTSLTLENAEYRKYSIKDCEPFNPKYHYSKQQQENLFHEIIRTKPLPVVKLLSNHSKEMVSKFTNTQYKMIFIKPSDVRKQALSFLIADKTNFWFGNRPERLKLKGKLKFTASEIQDKILDYKNHMLLEMFCAHSFYSDTIISNSKLFLESLNLSNTKIMYKYVPPFISDIDMLENINEFNDIWNKQWLETYGVHYE